MLHTVEVDEVLEERVAKAQDSTTTATKSDKPIYAPPTDPRAFSPQTRLVVRTMKSPKSDEGGLNSIGVTWADISVSEE